MSRRACWAAAPRSMANWPIAARRPTTMEWEARGAKGWGWKDVVPYFRKVERDLDFDGPFHGKDGRIPVRRIPRQHWTRHSQAVAEAFERAGYPFLPDQNGEFVDGYFPITHSNQAEQRVSAAMGY